MNTSQGAFKRGKCRSADKVLNLAEIGKDVLFLLSKAVIHYLFKSEHTVTHQVIGGRIGFIRVGMMTVELKMMDNKRNNAVNPLINLLISALPSACVE